MKKKFSDKHALCKIWEVLDSKYIFSLPLRGLLMSFASMLLAAGLNLYDVSFRSRSDIISAFSAMTFCVLLVYFPV